MNIAVDTSLTPENAKSKGYIWVQNVYYDPDPELQEEMKDIRDLVLKKQYRLGMPASIMAKHIVQGLYAPLKKAK